MVPRYHQPHQHATARIPLLSFFTGAGFLDLGFLQSGFNVVWHNENNSAFVRAFETGIGAVGYDGRNTKIQNTKSIVDVSPGEIIHQAFGTREAPRHFGVIGGPPCPDFSVGGKNRGRIGEQGILTEVFFDRILSLGPSFFLFENVPGLFTTKKHRRFLSDVLSKVSIRYYLDLKILNALNFGVPQDRDRLFVVGIRKDWIKEHRSTQFNSKVVKTTDFVSNSLYLRPERFLNLIVHWFDWPEDRKFTNAKARFSWPTDPVPRGEVPEKPDCPDDLMVGTYVCNESRFELPNSLEYFKPNSSKFSRVLEGDVTRKSFKRLHRFRYSPTAAYGNNEVHLHPTEPRRLSVRETMLIQSVPNEYYLPREMTLSAKFKTIGNGVPVKLANAVAKSVRGFLSE